MKLRIALGELTYVERLYIYHYLPGSIALHVVLQWNPPATVPELQGTYGKEYYLEEIMHKADSYKVRHIVFDGPLPTEAAEKLIEEGYYVSVRYVEPLNLPEEANLFLASPLKDVPKREWLEVAVNSFQEAERVPKEVPIHTFKYEIYEELYERQGYYYVYNHDQPLREDTRCPRCKTPNAIREMGRLIAWDGPQCRKCGYRIKYKVAELPKPSPRLHEILAWQTSFVVI
ncbi:hypothetical protein EYM_05070 [Ignicoccus islandicus DSM 13165]|uniref:Uncharacterized protein n=1 Tax=Ignicoccus islandicus DSM 13165 TaxID=940295 RepID=A0A0U3FRR3_9CREN|nr:hypothetical protein [Ignicoccus islandicus]ALU12551.1 hypothetical protein EYM_05070 [Ignicoccus islandicus DSM 13165]